MAKTQFIQTRCSECPRIVEAEVDKGALDKFMMRWETVQVLFHSRTADEREAIMARLRACLQNLNCVIALRRRMMTVESDSVIRTHSRLLTRPISSTRMRGHPG